VLIDASIIRLVVVPASMFLIGRLNWWMPGWLDRIVPRLEAEGHPAAQPAAVGAAR
jgi:RND superfamily putative drug exporter